jgi:hypothetical protein
MSGKSWSKVLAELSRSDGDFLVADSALPALWRKLYCFGFHLKPGERVFSQA